MRICVFSLGLLWAMSLQWQNSCFNNPGAPYCQGRDFAVKNKPAKNSGSGGSTSSTGSPGPTFVSRIDWRFADPQADAVLGINVSKLAASPLARNLLAQLGAKQNVSEADMKKIFEGFSGIDEIAVSVREKQYVVMLAGGITELVPPKPEPGIKSLPLSATAMLFGTAEAVDQAAQRINMKAPLSDLELSAQERQASSEFWANGLAAVVGQPAVDLGIKRFWLMVSARDRLASDIALEFNTPPGAKTLQSLTLPGAAVEGNVVHAAMSVEANEVQQKFGEIVPSPLGEKLASLAAAARQLPGRDINVLKQTRPVIYGLDNGPKVVSQQPNQ